MSEYQTPWRKARIEAGVSLRGLEARTGINRGRLSMIERGLQPSPGEAAKILAALPRAESPDVSLPAAE